MHWKSFAPDTWKIGTLRTLVTRAYTICSDERDRNSELYHLKKVFKEINGYPDYVIKKVDQNVKEKQKQIVPPATPSNVPSVPPVEIQDVVTPKLILPFKGPTGVTVVKKLKNSLKHTLPANVQPRILYRSKKLSSFFSLKDRTNKQHRHDVVYRYKCSGNGCSESYIGETKCRLEKRIAQHYGGDKRSHVYQHTMESGHPPASIDDFTILDHTKGYYRRTISEALHIRELKPTLNKQGQSIPLKLVDLV